MMLHCLMKLVHLDSASAAACTIHSNIYSKAATLLGSTTFSTQHSRKAASDTACRKLGVKPTLRTPRWYMGRWSYSSTHSEPWY
jgi:hypothetical protein